MSNKIITQRGKRVDVDKITLTVSDVSELLTLTGIDGDTVIVTDEDRGGVFVYRSADSTVNNEGTIFNGWCRQYDGAVNVKWFGIDNNGTENVTSNMQYIFDNFDNIKIESGIYKVNELVIPSNRTITGEENLSTIFKWDILISGTGKAVVRVSKNIVGVNPVSGGDTSRTVLKNISIDATGCDYGLYALYVTNESKFINIVSAGATLCNISILKSWFAEYVNLVAKNGVEKGISIGIPLSGETGDLAVNSCKIDNIRAHNNGTGGTYNVATNLSGGAGIIIGGVFRGDLGVVQSEQNYGTGLYMSPAYGVNISSLYLESNCKTDLANNRGLCIIYNGTLAGIRIDMLFLASTERIYNTQTFATFGHIQRDGNIDTFINTGAKANVISSNLASYSATTYDSIYAIPYTVATFLNVNLRYSTLGNPYFYTDEVIIPYVIVIPRSTVTMTNALSIKIDSNSYANYGNTFTAGVPIKIRHVNLAAGMHTLSTQSATQNIDNYVDIIVIQYKIQNNINRP